MGVKAISYVISIIVAIPIIAAALAPNNIDNLYIEYIVFLVSRFYLELIIVFLMAIIFIFRKYFLSSINALVVSFREAPDSYLSKALILASVSMLVFSISSLAQEGYYAAKAKVYYVNNLVYRDFRKQMIEEINFHVALGEYHKALMLHVKLKKYFPDDHVVMRISYRLGAVERIVKYSEKQNRRGGRIIDSIGMDRRGITFLADAASIYPKNIEYFNDFLSQYNLLEKKYLLAVKVIEACSNSKKYKEKISVEKDILKIIFDPLTISTVKNNIKQGIYNNYYEAICEYTSKIGKINLIKIIDRSWNLKDLRKLAKKNK